MENCLKKAGEELIKKLNLFKIVQTIFVIELYYLGVNSLLNLPMVKSILVPVEIYKYNNIILGYFKEWNGIIGLIAVGLIIYGFAVIFLNFTPILKKYEIIQVYGDSGIFIGGWLILICITYKAYLYLNVWFILYVPLLWIVLNGIRKLLKYINNNVECIDIPIVD